jgi:C-terminal processing protease CtpA/Prc
MPYPAHCKRATLALLGTLLTLAAGCAGGSGDGNGDAGPLTCAEDSRKQFVLAVARSWYLFPELLPDTVDLASFATAEELLDHLTTTAREQRKDRYFSYLTTRTEENTLFGDGQFNGFGLRTRTDPGPRPFIIEVFEGSPAAEGGLERGDEIVAVDDGSGFVPVSELLADGATISDALGPADVGVQRGLRLLRDGTTRDVYLVKRAVTIDPVSDVYGARVLPLAGTTGVGYVNLRAYVSTADLQLRNAFAQFPAGLDYFIVDLRYNGGGLVSIAELLNDLFGAGRSTSDVQLRLLHNPARSSNDLTSTFSPRPQSVQPVRIAFLTTEATASASEINVNAMAPWVEVAIVGEDTLGKPVGQLAFDLGGSCDDRLRLVSFRVVNALGQGDYYDGLAETLTYACAASDTLEHPMGDPAEGMTAAALHWIANGSCEAPIAPAPAAVHAKPGGRAGADRFPMPGNPTPAQLWLPGIS